MVVAVETFDAVNTGLRIDAPIQSAMRLLARYFGQSDSRAREATLYSGGVAATRYVAPAVSHASPEDLWVRSHRGEIAQHRGRWVAVSGAAIVAVGDSLRDVSADARGRGFQRSLVFKVPTQPRRTIIG
jgi:hypothetical protein